MDHPKYTTWLAALKDVPDARKARGQRFEWLFLLALISAALVSDQQTGSEIADWVHEPAAELVERLKPRRGSVPSEWTLRHALQQVDVASLKQKGSSYRHGLTVQSSPVTPTVPQEDEGLHGQAIDGKKVRGANAHGMALHLVSLVEHGTSEVLDQVAVCQKANEISAVSKRLEGRDLSDLVITSDAMLTHRALAQDIVGQGGHYFRVVKRNQPTLYDDIATLFREASWLPHEKAAAYQVHGTVNKGHSRLETRTLECSTTLNDYVDWPNVGQVMRRRCQRHIIQQGKSTDEST